MIYQNARPLNPFAGNATAKPKTYYQYRHFTDRTNDAVSSVRKAFGSGTKVKRSEQLFIVPGRRKYVVKLIDNTTFAIRTLLGSDNGVEHWEETAKEELPLRRSLSARIGTKIPRFKPALTTFNEPQSLSTALAKKSRHFESEGRVETLQNGKVKVFITELEINGEPSTSIVLRSEDRGALDSVIDSLPFDRTDNTNISEYLLPS